MTDKKLDDLEAQLAAARARQDTETPQSMQTYSREMSLGIRAFMEMIGVLLGAGLMGWALDRFFGTAPILLSIFIVLGIGAAFFNIYKLSRNLGTAIGSNGLQSDAKTANKPLEK